MFLFSPYLDKVPGSHGLRIAIVSHLNIQRLGACGDQLCKDGKDWGSGSQKGMKVIRWTSKIPSPSCLRFSTLNRYMDTRYGGTGCSLCSVV